MVAHPGDLCSPSVMFFGMYCYTGGEGEQIGRILGALWAQIGCGLGALWGQFGRTLGALWARFGRSLAALAVMPPL